MATYSINIGTPTESTKVQNLQSFLNKLPDNTAQLISPGDTRDALFTTWENILIKETSVASSSIGYIGLDSTILKAAMLLGKKSYTTQETLDDTLLNSDTDLFIFNGKSDSNPSVQDTKVSFLAGVIPSDYHFAPYIEASKITLPSRIDLSIVNPATAGVIQIKSDQVELGNNGWIINDSGALYPVIDGQDLGATPSNRIGNIFMASRIDYGSDLLWTVGSDTNMVLTTGGILSVDTLSASNVYIDNLQITTSATAGYVLSSDGFGRASWQPGELVAPGVTAGYIIISDGVGGANWQVNSAASSGSNGSIQFASNGILTSDNSNFYWDNTNKKLGISTNTPSTELDVIGSGSFSSNLTVGGSINTNELNVKGITTTNHFIFATAGYGVGKLLTSDADGNATWSDAPVNVLASGTLNAIQLSDGSGNFTDDANFYWDNNYDGGVLKIGNVTELGEYSGIGGIHLNGDLKLSRDNFIGLNTYFNSSYKRIDNGYSSWIKQETSGEFKINLASSDIENSIINSTKSITILNDTGFVGLNITPDRQLHINGIMRLQPLEITPLTGSAGDICYSNQEYTKEAIAHDGTDWFKLSNRTMFAIDSVNMMTTDATFNGISTTTSGVFTLFNRWTLRSFADDQNRNAFTDFVLPQEYIPGRNLNVILYYTWSGSTDGTHNINWMLGVTKTTSASGSGGNYSDDTNAQYFTNEPTLPSGVYNYPDLKTEFSIKGDGFIPGTKLALTIIRLVSDVETSTIYLSGVEIVML